jgi:hypothetical protein
MEVVTFIAQTRCPYIAIIIVWFSSVPPGICWASTLNYATITLFHILAAVLSPPTATLGSNVGRQFDC